MRQQPAKKSGAGQDQDQVCTVTVANHIGRAIDGVVRRAARRSTEFSDDFIDDRIIDRGVLQSPRQEKGQRLREIAGGSDGRGWSRRGLDRLASGDGCCRAGTRIGSRPKGVAGYCLVRGE